MADTYKHRVTGMPVSARQLKNPELGKSMMKAMDNAIVITNWCGGELYDLPHDGYVITRRGLPNIVCGMWVVKDGEDNYCDLSNEDFHKWYLLDEKPTAPERSLALYKSMRTPIRVDLTQARPTCDICGKEATRKVFSTPLCEEHLNSYTDWKKRKHG